MTAVAQAAGLDERVIAAASRWYAEHERPQVFDQVHPLVLAHALRVAGGDLRRCVVGDDGSIDVLNRPCW